MHEQKSDTQVEWQRYFYIKFLYIYTIWSAGMNKEHNIWCKCIVSNVDPRDFSMIYYMKYIGIYDTFATLFASQLGY